MGESDESLLKTVKHYQEGLDRHTENKNENKLLHYLQKLYKLPLKVKHLEETGVGRTVNSLRKINGPVGESAKSLVAKWKTMVIQEQQEDTDEPQSPDITDESSREEPIMITSSSHGKSDNNRTDKTKRESSSKSEHNSRKNGHKHKSSHKRKSSSSSEDEGSKKRPKKEDDPYKSKHRESEDDSKKDKKHKSDRHKSSEKQKSHESSLNDTQKMNKSKEKSDKHKSKKEDSKRHEHSSKTKDSEKKKDGKSDDKKNKKTKVNGSSSTTGIDSGSGASFAEALGMCEPSSSSSKTAPKKKPEKKEKEKTPSKDAVPKLLKEPVPLVEPLDINLANLLPAITPNYRPLGNFPPTEHAKKVLSESETLSNIIYAKNQRTKVFSGVNKGGTGHVSSLFNLCIRVLQDNIDALEYTGGVPYSILKPVLQIASPVQLHNMEHHNPYLVEDTDELWARHCDKEFKKNHRQEMETWREMYLRCFDERDAKLKALTANIKQAQDKSLPVRMTKLAYVDSLAKPPRNIARRQMKNGTAFDMRKPSQTPTAKLASLATAGEAGKVAVPNPGSRAMERSSGHAVKPKKAPLMLKSISSFKNRFKR